MIAYCWRNGVIEFGRKVPAGAIGLARGRARLLRKEVRVSARLAYDGKTLLVPGVPEASSSDEALHAVSGHIAWLRKRQRETGIEVRS